ncbi:MAG TPA: S8 family peptidase [Gaiellaceae bacterium]|nr:S8 family peptidase [Gaiellaceae bacterium]
MKTNVTLAPKSRIWMLLLFVAATISTVGLVTASAGSAASRKDPADVRPAPPVKADADGNKLFDDLEVRVGALHADADVEVIVRLAAKATPERVADAAKAAGPLRGVRRFELVDAFAATVNKGQLNALARLPWVLHVEENATVRALNDGAQTSFGVSKARIDAPSLDGAGRVAAVIDTGIDAAHVDLDGGKVVAFKDFVNARSEPYDDNGHGTHVAATLAGDRGVAPAARLVGVKVLDAAGGGSMADVTGAIEWVVQNKDVYGIDVINMSLGAAGCADGTDTTSVAVDNAKAAGLLVAVAAGNEGPGSCSVGAPAAARGALTVGAMADTTERGFSLAAFSSRGPTADGRVKPDVVAPGVNITSAQSGTGSGTVAFDGTSMATPFVAGLALLLEDANTAITPDGVRNALVGTAIDWGRTGVDSEYGAGRIDAYAALKSVGAALGEGPTAPAHVLREGTLGGSGAYVDYTLQVTEVGFPIAATLVIPGVRGAVASSPDFDLYLYNPAGAMVARAETVQRQENVAFTPTTTGTYKLRVASYSGSGAFVLDASAGLGTAPAPAPAPAPVPAPVASSAYPSAVVIQNGAFRAGDMSRLASDDNLTYDVSSTTYSTYTTGWYARITGVSNALRSLALSVRTKHTRSCTQTLWIYDWTYGIWERLDVRTVGSTEAEVAGSLSGTLADFVSGTSGDGEVRLRLRCQTAYGTFVSSADLVRVDYTK